MSQSFFSGLPQPPRNKNGISPLEFSRWLDKIWLIMQGIPGFAWSIIDKTGSNLTDIQTRHHADLQQIKTLDVTSSDTTKDRHLSDAQSKIWQTHVDITDGNPHNTKLSYLPDVTITNGKRYDTLELNESGQWVNVPGGNAVFATNYDDVGGNIAYLGEAQPGSLTSASVWRIRKLDMNSNDLVITWANGNDNFTNKWTDRLTLTYS